MRAVRWVLMGLTVCLAAPASATILSFDLLGYNESNFTFIHENAGGGSGDRFWNLVEGGPSNASLLVELDDANGNGQLDDGERIASPEGAEGVLQLSGTGGRPDGLLRITSFDLTLGNGADGAGHHIDAAAFDWTLELEDLDPMMGTATFGHLNGNTFNHVSLTDGELSMQLWGSFLSVAQADARELDFPRGLGLDLGLRGPEREVPAPSSLALLALGLGGTLRARRRRAQG